MNARNEDDRLLKEVRGLFRNKPPTVLPWAYSAVIVGLSAGTTEYPLLVHVVALLGVVATFLACDIWKHWVTLSNALTFASRKILHLNDKLKGTNLPCTCLTKDCDENTSQEPDAK